MANAAATTMQKRANAAMDLIIAFVIVSIVFIIVVPIPGVVLDFLLALNLSVAIIVILTTIYVPRVLDFSVFPSLLLIVTIFGLGLNISTTRQILFYGPRMNVQLIRTFGNFVVGGNYVVGFIIFIILIIIQFVVISRGATRVSEVAARFKLDAMNTKNMAILQDLEAGVITPEEAERRKKELDKLNEFYGNMDGASKFVQGNIIAAFIITLINIIGGLIVGVAMRGESLADAVKTYTLFTVGDGLLSQIPSLLTATGMGILVTRLTEQEALGKELVAQLASVPKVLYISGGLLVILALVTPLPKVQLLIMGGIFIILAYISTSSIKKREAAEKIAEQQRAASEKLKVKPEDVTKYSAVDDVTIEFGYALIPLFAEEQGGEMLERVTVLRRNLARNIGLVVPPVAMHDNVFELAENEYRFLIKGVEVDRFAVKLGHLLVLSPSAETEDQLPGEPAVDPVYRVPGKWILEKDREKAEQLGYIVVDIPTLMITHFQTILIKHASEIFSRAELKKLFATYREKSPSVDIIMGNWDAPLQQQEPALSIGRIHKIFCTLLDEQLPIKDVATIADVIVDNSNKPVPIIIELIRRRMANYITNLIKHSDGKIYVITVDPQLEDSISKKVHISEDELYDELDYETKTKLVNKFREVITEVMSNGYKPVVLCDFNIRGYLWRLLKPELPNVREMYVVSYNEITAGVELINLRTVNIQ